MKTPILILAIGLTASPVPLIAAGAEGTWAGKVACSSNLLSRSPEYSQPLSIRIRGDTGQGLIEDTQTAEHFELQIGADGRVRIQSQGAWKNAPDRRWSIRTEGRFEGGSIASTGTMVSGDGRTLVRERCVIELAQAATSAAGAPATTTGQGNAAAAQGIPAFASGTVSGAGSGQGNAALATFDIEHAGEPLPYPLSTHQAARKYPMIAAQFPEWLLEFGQSWAFRGAPSPAPRPIRGAGTPPRDRNLFEQARRLVESKEIKAIVFVDGDQVAYATGRPGLSPLTLLPSASISKTVTAVGVGKAVCTGRLLLEAPLASLIPGLQGTAIGAASLRETLLMASGSGVHGHGVTPAETSQHFDGTSSLVQLLLTPRFTQTSAKPGQRFVYKSIDPYLAMVATQTVLGQPFTRLLQDEVFSPMRSGEAVILDTDRQGNFLATGGVRMSLADWIRFAAFVREQRAGSGCFADYLKAMSKAQLRIDKIPGVNGWFNGYGYFTWTDNDAAPDSFWAVGHFGQRIAWSTDPRNPRMFLTFGVESDRDMAALYALAARWMHR